jgi:arylsulfatase A
VSSKTNQRRVRARRFSSPSLITLSVLAGTVFAEASPAQPNVVVFFVDDMGVADWQIDPVANPTGSRVYETPNMLRLASEGVTFLNAYASAPVCSPSRASLMTGKSVARHGISDFIGGSTTASGTLVRTPSDWVQNVPASEVLLAEALQGGGYRTGVFGKWHLGQTGNPAANPLLQGFDTNIAGVASGNPGFAGGFFAGPDGAWAGMPGLNIPGTYPPDEYLSDAIAERAASFIADRAAADEPFFVYMPHYVVHTPIEAPAALVSYYQSKINGLSPAAVNGHTNATYAAMVQKMDESLGMILDTLDDPDGDPGTDDSIRDETIVIFTADNGGLTNFGITDNRPYRDGKGSVHGGGIREPLIVSFTGNAEVPRGAANADALAITHDLYPTILDWTGVAGDPTQNAEMDGVSLVPVLEGGSAQPRDLVWHYPHRSPQAVSSSQPVAGGAWVSAIRRDETKLMYFYDERRFEMYDVETDPAESNDLYDAADPLAGSLSRAMFEGLRGVGARFPRDIGNELPLPGTAIAAPLGPVAGSTFSRSPFDDPQDFRSGSVGATGFDGVLNPGLASVFDQAITQPGALTIRNAGLTRFVAGAIEAPLLYRDVTGDFEAVLEIGSMDDANFHVVAMLAADPEDADHRFLWVGQQNREGPNDFAQARSIVDGVREREAGEGGVFPFYRLVRDGDSFIGFHSDDGGTWIPYVEFTRPDLPGTVRLGITQALFSATPGTATIELFEVSSQCLADLADPAGVLDLADISAFVAGFLAGDPVADLNGDAVFDLADIERFVASFTAGCS